MQNLNAKILQERINKYNTAIREAKEAEANRNHINVSEKYANHINIIQAQTKAKLESKRFSEWSDKVRTQLLYEFMMNIFSNCFSKIITEDARYDNLKKNLVLDFIKTEGSLNVLNSFKKASTFLSEMALFIESEHKKITSSVDKKDKEYVIDTLEKQHCFDVLDMSNVDGLCDTIRNKVQDAIEAFVATNNENRMKIAEVLNNAKAKIEGSKDDSIKESVSIYSNSKIRQIENRPTNIFGEMVTNMCKNLYKLPVDQRSTMTLESGKLDMEAVVESCKVIYTFLEMLNTSRMHKFTTDELTSFVVDIGK